MMMNCLLGLFLDSCPSYMKGYGYCKLINLRKLVWLLSILVPFFLRYETETIEISISKVLGMKIVTEIVSITVVAIATEKVPGTCAKAEDIC